MSKERLYLYDTTLSARSPAGAASAEDEQNARKPSCATGDADA